uniref:THAP-type domain-containing protein n=1 Tax=Knipowitschia caucasica TaxID=637954 RepID=A0AAV2LWT0_KNICA
MPHCAAFGCNFQSKGNKGSEVSLHSFPKEPKLRILWEDSVEEDELLKDPRLFSRHFSSNEFEAFHRPQLMKELAGASGYKRRLKPDSVPTIFSHKKTKRPRVTSENRVKSRERREALDTYLGQPASPLTAAPNNSQHDCEPALEEVNTATWPSTLLTSVSVQCLPIVCDASTQTEISMSDAAVQYEANANVHVSAADPNYSGEGDIDLDGDGDCNSEDLFSPTPDDSSVSQPQCSQSDPDFVESSSSQLTDSQMSTNTPTARVFLVFEDQLFRRCVKYGSLIAEEDVELQNEGSQLTLEVTCANSCSYRWRAQPALSGTKGAGNLLLTTSVFFSGIHFAKFEWFCCNMKLKSISEDT